MLSRTERRSAIRRSVGVVMEMLERRVLLSTTATANLPDPIIPIKLPEAPLPLQGVVGTPESLDPSMLNTTYGFNDIAFNVGGVDSDGNLSGGTDYQGNGAGTTIAIVDAFGSPTIVNDLETFDSHWGLSNNDAEGNFALTIQPLGGVNVSPGPVDTSADWALETSLDVEWVHAVAPGAHILLVESPDASIIHMLDSVVYAAEQPGVVDVSMSWGSDVNSTDFPIDSPAIYDGYFATPDGHLDSNGVLGGVTFVASSGDDGNLSYPAASAEVLSVGGMTVTTSLDGTFIDEGPWANVYGSSGGGSDTIYDNPYNTPFVSLDADPATGVWIYDSTPDNGTAGWQVVGGTSLACPVWAAYVSIMDQGIMLSGGGSLNGSQTNNALIYAGEENPEYYITDWGGAPPTYPLSNKISDLNDNPIPDYTAIPGNGNTGFGIPNSLYFDPSTDLLSNPLVSFMLSNYAGVNSTVAFQSTSIPQLAFVQGPTNVTAGQTISPSITVDEPNGTLTGSVTLSVSLLSPSGSATLLGTTTEAASGGVATFTDLSIDQSGTYELQASESGFLSATSSQFTVSATTPTELGFTTQPGSSWQFGPITPAVVVGMEDTFGNVVKNSANSVTISIESGPSGGALSGETTVGAVNGSATFDDLVLSKAGVYTLLATSGGLTSAISDSFTVVGIPAMQRYLFNGAALGAVLLLQQEHRNAGLVASQGPPTSQEVAAAAAVSAPAVSSVLAPADVTSTVSAAADTGASDSPGPSFSFVPIAGSSDDSDSQNTDDLNSLLSGS